ncbi:hypothetical protein pb186bvf_001803 [Paramecium bursaria]
MHEEQHSLTQSVTKSIVKQRKNKLKRNLPQLICLVKVPRLIKEDIFIFTEVEIKLALSFIQERCLGQLKENPVTYNNRVSRADQMQDVFFFTLEPQDRQRLKKEQVLKRLDLVDDPSKEQAKELVIESFTLLDEYKNQVFISNEDVELIEQQAQNFPYQCTIYKVNSDSLIITQRVLNEKFLTLMGVTKEMMFHHLKETEALVTPFDLGGQLQTWCELSRNSLKKECQFQMNLNTYEGHTFPCTVELKQMFKKAHFNPKQIIMVEYFIFKPDQRMTSLLNKPERIYKNQIDYFNKKHIELEFQQFKQKFQEIESRKYHIPKPCGFRELFQ